MQESSFILIKRFTSIKIEYWTHNFTRINFRFLQMIATDSHILFKHYPYMIGWNILLSLHATSIVIYSKNIFGLELDPSSSLLLRNFLLCLKCLHQICLLMDLMRSECLIYIGVWGVVQRWYGVAILVQEISLGAFKHQKHDKSIRNNLKGKNIKKWKLVMV